MKLIFELGGTGRGCALLPPCQAPYAAATFARREKPLNLPEVSETEISRHYTEFAKQSHGVNDGFYPLGSCTMKYNPKVNEAAASLPGFSRIHPLQPAKYAQGCLKVFAALNKALCAITGMDICTLQPAAGAHGEFTGLLLIKAYHLSRNDAKRTKIIVPDSAHGTNPASAAMAGFEIVNIPSDVNGYVDLEALKKAVGDDTAGLMLTNPNTVGLFDHNIAAITDIVHAAGGLCYYDGANLNAIMGVCRPGDMGFDVMHLNLHKTFATPHGGGGPGSGPVACKAFLAPFLPGIVVVKSAEGYAATKAKSSIGEVRSFTGNFLVMVRALCYILTLGAEGIKEASANAVLNANYMMHLLKPYYKMAFDHTCMHEFVMTLQHEKHTLNVSALDIAKALLDHGIHPPTMYFPLIVHEALMIEPTETECKSTLEEVAQIFIDVLQKAEAEPESMHQYPLATPVRRLDEVMAARKPVIKYAFEK